MGRNFTGQITSNKNWLELLFYINAKPEGRFKKEILTINNKSKNFIIKENIKFNNKV